MKLMIGNYVGLFISFFALTAHGFLSRSSKFSSSISISSKNNVLFSSLLLSSSSALSTADVMKSFFSNEPLPLVVNDILSPVRQLGLESLNTIPLPAMKDEAWRHNNLKTLFNQPYQQSLAQLSNIPDFEEISMYIDELCTKSCLVFVDGIFTPSLSRTDGIPSEISAGSLLNLHVEERTRLLQLLSSERVPDQGEQPRSSFASDLLSAVTMMRLRDVAVVSVPAGVTAPPIQTLFLSTASTSTSLSSYPCLLISLGEDSSLALKQSLASTTTTDTPPSVISGDVLPSLSMGLTQVTVASGAQLRHTYSQECSDRSRVLDVISTDVQKDAQYQFSAVQLGGKIGRLNVHVNLTHTGANCSVYGVSLGLPGRSQDIHSSVQHLEKETTSEQKQRNVVADRGECVFKGRIRMPPIAQQSASEQLCRSLLLGSAARLQAMPVLEIAADDVTCSHGAAVADLDENAMFYLSSRGVNRREARQLLLGSFSLELLANSLMDKAALKRVARVVDLLNASEMPLEQVDQRAGGSMGFTSM